MNIYEYLEKYRIITLDLMDEIERNDQISSLIEAREEIINSIKSHDFDKEEIKSIVNSLNLMKLEEELQSIYKKEKMKIKKQIESLKKARQVNTSYNTIEDKARVFNESI